MKACSFGAGQLWAALLFIVGIPVGWAHPTLVAQDHTLFPQTESNYQPQAYQGHLEPDDGQWLRPAKDFASTRYSALDQINTQKCWHLKPAFTFSTGMTRGHEAAPLVVNNTMYIVTPYPNNLYALDLTKPGAPMKWVYQPLPTPASQGVACCDVVNRGAVILRRKDLLTTRSIIRRSQ